MTYSFAILFLLKARTHRPIFTESAEESAIESADFTAESADSTANSIIAHGSRPTIGVGRREIAPVGTGL